MGGAKCETLQWGRNRGIYVCGEKSRKEQWIGKSRQKGPEFFQERRGSQAPVLGRALKERVPEYKKGVESHTQAHTHQGRRKTGHLQGVLNEHLGVSSLLKFKSIIKCPVQVVLITRMECSR